VERTTPVRLPLTLTLPSGRPKHSSYFVRYNSDR
jgi:hypothetical protein